METINKKTLEQLAVYLPYGLQACGASEIWTIIGASQRKIIMDCGLWQSAIPYDDFSIDYDVLLSPLSDYADIKLSESLEANEYTRAEIYKYAHGDMELGKLRYDAILTMARNHIDIFNWIPQGLAVNLNTIER